MSCEPSYVSCVACILMRYEGNVYNHHLQGITSSLAAWLLSSPAVHGSRVCYVTVCRHQSLLRVCAWQHSLSCVCAWHQSLSCVCACSKVCHVCVQVSEAAHVHTHSSGQEQRHGCGEWGEQWGPGAVTHPVPSPLCPADP